MLTRHLACTSLISNPDDPYGIKLLISLISFSKGSSDPLPDYARFQIMAEREQRRIDEVEARAAKLRAAYEKGGGSILAVSAASPLGGHNSQKGTSWGLKHHPIRIPPLSPSGSHLHTHLPFCHLTRGVVIHHSPLHGTDPHTQAGLEEKARADAARADRIQAEYEKAQDEKAARERARRQEETENRVKTLKQQVKLLQGISRLLYFLLFLKSF